MLTVVNALVVCLCLVIGAAIGAVGIGGVFLVPALNLLAGLDVRSAIAVAMAGFIFTGIIGTAFYSHLGHITLRQALWLCLGATPGALFGSFFISLVPQNWLLCGIAFLLFLNALTTLNVFRLSSRAGLADFESTVVIITIGAIAGFGSSITGTGGPLIVLPLFMILRTPASIALGFSQASQLPISIAATSGHVWLGQLDFSFVIPVAAGLSVGVVIGVIVANIASEIMLRNAIAIISLTVAAMILYRLPGN